MFMQPRGAECVADLLQRRGVVLVVVHPALGPFEEQLRFPVAPVFGGVLLQRGALFLSQCVRHEQSISQMNPRCQSKTSPNNSCVSVFFFGLGCRVVLSASTMMPASRSISVRASTSSG